MCDIVFDLFHVLNKSDDNNSNNNDDDDNNNNNNNNNNDNDNNPHMPNRQCNVFVIDLICCFKIWQILFYKRY